MKKQFAIIVSFAMLLCGCTANSSSSKDKTSAAQAVEFSITDHTLQEIIILGNESPTTVDAAEERISELNENLQIKLGGELSSIVLRGWNAMDRRSIKTVISPLM